MVRQQVPTPSIHWGRMAITVCSMLVKVALTPLRADRVETSKGQEPGARSACWLAATMSVLGCRKLGWPGRLVQLLQSSSAPHALIMSLMRECWAARTAKQQFGGHDVTSRGLYAI